MADLNAQSLSNRGSLIAIGRSDRKLELWDAEARRQVRVIENHTDRVSCLSWNGTNLITSGSKDS